MRIEGKYFQMWDELRPDKSGGKRQPGPARPAKGDAVELSNRALLMQQARAALEQVDPARAARVDDLKRKVDSGQYNPPADKVAARMLES